MSTTHLNWIVTTLALTLSSPLRAGEPYQQKQSQGFLNSLSNMVFSRSVSEQPRKIDALKAKELLEERLMENQKSRLQQRIQQDNFRASQAQQGVAFGNVSANQQLDQTFNMPQGVYQQTPNSLDMNQGLFDARTLSTAVMLPPTPPDRPDHPPLLKIFVPDDGITIPRPSDMILIDEDQVRRLTPEKTPEPEVTQTQPDAQPLREGRVRAHIGDGPRVEIRASYRVNIPEEGYRWLELQLDGVVVRKATIGDQDLRVVPDGRALVKGPINDTLELEIDTLGERDDDQGRFTLRLPPCPTTRVELDLPGVELETNADGLLDLTSTSATGRTLISAWASKRNIQVTYYKATPEPITRIDDATPGVAHTPAEPEARITAKLHTQYEYADGVLTGTTFGNFSITKPGVSQISLSLPVGMELISITDGENKRLDTFAFDAGEKNSNLTLFLPARRTRPLDLTIIQKRIVGGVATRIIELHPAAMSDATKVTLTGSFVGPAQGAHFEPAFSESDGLIEDIDITKVDPIFVHKLSQSPIAAWRVLKPERTDWGSLEIHRNRLRKASIQKFEILEAQADSIMTGDAVALTRILLKINNTREQFLAIQLPAGSSIQSVFVRNRPVKPGLQAASEIVIPLVKSKILGTGPETFLVEIIYRHSTSAYATAGTVNVELLKIKGKIAVFDWRIYFPEGLELKERQTTPGLVFDGRNGSTTQTFVMPASRMNEITNNYDARTQNAAIQAPVREHSGMLPVRVPFPEDYRGFKYTKRLVPEDAAPLSVTYYYVKRSNLMFLTNILLALSFMFAAGIIYAATRRTSILGPGSGVLICLGLLASIESLFGLRLSYLGGVQMALLLGLAHLLLYPFRRWLTPLIVILPLLLFTHAQAAEESPKALYIVNDKRIIHAAKEDSAGFGLIDAKLVEELESKLKQELLTHKKEEPVAPVPFIILEGRVTGNLENSVARLHFEYEVDILQEGWQRLPLITGDLTVSDVTVDAGTPGQVIVHETEQLIREEVSQNTVILNSLTTENEQLQNLSKSISFDLMIRGVGRHSVRFDAESSIARVSEEHYRLSISPPPFSRSAMELKLNAKDLNVRLDGRPVSNLEENTADGSTKLRVPLPMTRPIVVDWRERAIAALPVSIPSVVAFPSPTGRPGSDDQEDILADTSSAPSPPPPRRRNRQLQSHSTL